MVSVRENGRNMATIGLVRFSPLNISGGISVLPSDYGTLGLAVYHTDKLVGQKG